MHVILAPFGPLKKLCSPLCGKKQHTKVCLCLKLVFYFQSATSGIYYRMWQKALRDPESFTVNTYMQSFWKMFNGPRKYKLLGFKGTPRAR